MPIGLEPKLIRRRRHLGVILCFADVLLFKSTCAQVARRPFIGEKMSLIQEFKAFASRGNVIDMAVGIIIGAAFGKIVSSFVGDVIMPPSG